MIYNLSGIKYPEAEGKFAVDFAVIGGGITGLSCAEFLSESGATVAICEAKTVGGGLSAHGYGLTFDGKELKKLCEKVGEKTFREADFLGFSDRKKDGAKIAEEIRKYRFSGCKVKRLNRREAEKFFSFDINEGIFVESGAGTVNPYSLSEALASYISLKGVTVFENSGVKKISKENGHYILYTLKSIIKSGKIIDCRGSSVAEGRPFSVFTSSTEKTDKISGWYSDCAIKDYYSESISLYRDDGRIILQKREYFPTVFRSGKVDYAEKLLGSMFFRDDLKITAADFTVFREGKNIFSEKTGGYFTVPPCEIGKAVRNAGLAVREILK